jgi:FkbM family methyltransferase
MGGGGLVRGGSVTSITDSGHASIPSLLQQMAPTVFTMNPNDSTKILFPPKVEHIIIDIGAADSDYLAAVEQRNDPTVALILVDPVPESLVPLIERVAKFNLLDPGNYTLLNRVFALRGAMAETEQSHVNFQMSASNHCGSLLKANENNNFWCWDTASELVVTVFQLEHLLDMIPNSTFGIKSINVKIDAEGADLLVLKGGGKALERVSSVVIECGGKNLEFDNTTEGARREGMCNDDEAIEYMCKERNFCRHEIEDQGGLSNIFFWNANSSSTFIPDILTEGGVTYQKWYQDLSQFLHN